MAWTASIAPPCACSTSSPATPRRPTAARSCASRASPASSPSATSCVSSRWRSTGRCRCAPRSNPTRPTAPTEESRFRHPLCVAGARVCGRSWVRSNVLAGVTQRLARPAALATADPLGGRGAGPVPLAVRSLPPCGRSRHAAGAGQPQRRKRQVPLLGGGARSLMAAPRALACLHRARRARRGRARRPRDRRQRGGPARVQRALRRGPGARGRGRQRASTPSRAPCDARRAGCRPALARPPRAPDGAVPGGRHACQRRRARVGATAGAHRSLTDLSRRRQRRPPGRRRAVRGHRRRPGHAALPHRRGRRRRARRPRRGHQAQAARVDGRRPAARGLRARLRRHRCARRRAPPAGRAQRGLAAGGPRRPRRRDGRAPRRERAPAHGGALRLGRGRARAGARARRTGRAASRGSARRAAGAARGAEPRERATPAGTGSRVDPALRDRVASGRQRRLSARSSASR